MNRWIVILATALVAGSAALVGASLARSTAPGGVASPSPRAAPGARDVAFLVDRSDSIEDGNGSACAFLVSLYGRAVATEGVNETSRVQAFLTGNGVGRHMPKLAERFRMPLLEGGEFVAKDRILLDTATREVRSACRAGVARLELSPIYDSMKAVLEQMRTDWGCGAAHPCSLLVASDLQETQIKGLRDVLRGKKGSLPDPLVNAGIDVFACGYGDTTERMSDTTVEATKVTWSKLVPGIVIVPSCA